MIRTVVGGTTQEHNPPRLRTQQPVSRLRGGLREGIFGIVATNASIQRDEEVNIDRRPRSLHPPDGSELSRLPSYCYSFLHARPKHSAASPAIKIAWRFAYTLVMTITQLDHVAIHVEDVDRSVAFYRDVLKLEPLPRPDFDFPGAWFRIGPQQELHLIGARDSSVHSGNRGNHYAMEVTGIAAWETHLANHGATFMPAKKRPDGATQIFVQDPDGHYIELCDKSTMH